MADLGRAPSGQALAVPATPASAVDGPTGFDPSRKSIASRLPPDFHIAYTSSVETIQLNGTISNQDELRAVAAVLELMCEWLPVRDGGVAAAPPFPPLGGGLTPAEWLRSAAATDRKLHANMRASEAEAIAEWIEQITERTGA